MLLEELGSVGVVGLTKRSIADAALPVPQDAGAVSRLILYIRVWTPAEAEAQRVCINVHSEFVNDDG